MDKCVVVIPCFDLNVFDIEAVLEGLACHEQIDKIILVDDCCPRNCLDTISETSLIVKIKTPKNSGVGGAFIYGTLWAVAQYNTPESPILIVKIDGDNQHLPDCVNTLIAAAKETPRQIIKTERYSLSPFFEMNQPRIRMLGNAGLTFLTKMATGYWDKQDFVNGMFAVPSDIMEFLIYTKSIRRRYLFETSLFCAASDNNIGVVEVPNIVLYRDEKSSLDISSETFKFGKFLFFKIVSRWLTNHILPNLTIGGFFLASSALFFFLGMFGLLQAVVFSDNVLRGETIGLTLVFIVSILSFFAFLAYDIFISISGSKKFFMMPASSLKALREQFSGRVEDLLD